MQTINVHLSSAILFLICYYLLLLYSIRQQLNISNIYRLSCSLNIGIGHWKKPCWRVSVSFTQNAACSSSREQYATAIGDICRQNQLFTMQAHIKVASRVRLHHCHIYIPGSRCIYVPDKQPFDHIWAMERRIQATVWLLLSAYCSTCSVFYGYQMPLHNGEPDWLLLS